MYKVDVSCKEGSTFNVTSGAAQMTIDTAEKNNMSPLHALLGALGACAGVFLRRYADDMKLPIGEFSISVSADLVKAPQMIFKKIDISIDLNGVELDAQKKEGLMRFVQHCPVGNTLRGNPEIGFELK